MMGNDEKFDVFLCHNSADKPVVKKIGEKLKKEGIRPWLDEWELRPGFPWQKILEEQIQNIRAAAVFVGKNGIGPWEDMELDAFIREFVKRKCPVIPVIIKGCKGTPELPPFLGGMTFVDFRKKNPDPTERLIWGITGQKKKSEPTGSKLYIIKNELIQFVKSNKIKSSLFFLISLLVTTAFIYGENISNWVHIMNFKKGITQADKDSKGQILRKQIPGGMESEFIWIPSGCYDMGCDRKASDCPDYEEPVHEVCVDGFWMGKHEVTQGQWESIMGDGSNPSKFKHGDNFPVENVSWNDVKRFIRRLNETSGETYRLPTEAEWEYACRGGSDSARLSDESRPDGTAWCLLNNKRSPQPVMSKPSASFGLHDMKGNVWEWCEDKYHSDAYSEHRPVNPVMINGSGRITRGGAWDSDLKDVTCTVRLGRDEGTKTDSLGFRLVKTP